MELQYKPVLNQGNEAFNAGQSISAEEAPRGYIKTVIEGAEKGWTTKAATAENSDEEDETNTPPANPDENVLG